MPRLAAWLFVLGLTLTFVTAAHHRHQRHPAAEGGETEDPHTPGVGTNATTRGARFAHLQGASSAGPDGAPPEDDDDADDDDDWERGSVDAPPPSSPDAARRDDDDGRPGRHGRNRNRNRNRKEHGRWGRARQRTSSSALSGGVRTQQEGEEEDDGEEAPRSCPRCQLHEEYKRLRLEAIKAEILSRLNLKEPPKMSNKTLPQNPTFSSLIGSFEMAGDAPYESDGGRGSYDEDDTYHVKPLEILLLATTPPANTTLNETNVCYFDLNSEVRDAKSITAEFGVYIKASRAPSVRSTLLRINKLERREHGVIIHKTVHLRQLRLDRESTDRWYRFSMDRIVKSWVQHPNNNLGLQVEAFDYDGTLLAIVQTDNAREEPLKPYLEVQVKGTSRPKRHLPVPDCTAMSKEKRCCRYPLIVDFVAMKWDWILAPKQYKAYYCYGTCPFAYYRPYPHTHVVTQTLVSDFTPCCTPSELKQLLLFYRNKEQAIIYGRIPGMIVESCSCI